MGERSAVVWSNENEGCTPPMARFTDEADRISWIIARQRLGWLADSDGDPYLPSSPHDKHIYNGDCAICKAGNAPLALRVVIDAVLDAVEASEPDEHVGKGEGDERG